MPNTTPQAALLSDELHALIRSFGYTTNSQTHDLVTAIIAKMQATQEPVQAGELPDEREAFEAYARKRGYQRDELDRCRTGIVGPAYYNSNTEMAWQAWKARAVLSARKPLNSAQIRGMAIQEQFFLVCDSMEDLTCIVREVERAHGIGMEVKP